MDVEFVRFLSTLGVGGALAGLMFMVYRKDSKAWGESQKGQMEMMMIVVKENTAAIASNTATVSALRVLIELHFSARK